MDTVTEARMAAQMARLGGMGIIHYNMDTESQVDNVSQVRQSVMCFFHVLDEMVLKWIAPLHLTAMVYYF